MTRSVHPHAHGDDHDSDRAGARVLRDILESRVRVQAGTRGRSLPVEVSSKPHDGARKDPPSLRPSKTKTMRSPAGTVNSMGLGQVEQTSGWVSSVPTASPLDSIVRAGSRAMRQMALDHAVQEFLDRYSERVDAQGRRLVVRNAHRLSAGPVQRGGGLNLGSVVTLGRGNQTSALHQLFQKDGNGDRYIFPQPRGYKRC